QPACARLCNPGLRRRTKRLAAPLPATVPRRARSRHRERKRGKRRAIFFFFSSPAVCPLSRRRCVADASETSGALPGRWGSEQRGKVMRQFSSFFRAARASPGAKRRALSVVVVALPGLRWPPWLGDLVVRRCGTACSGGRDHQYISLRKREKSLHERNLAIYEGRPEFGLSGRTAPSAASMSRVTPAAARSLAVRSSDDVENRVAIPRANNLEKRHRRTDGTWCNAEDAALRTAGLEEEESRSSTTTSEKAQVL
ncbi:Protein of unknown function, partial [Gryllus bimaculatus]